MRSLIFLLSPLLLSSCMHLGMIGSHGDEQSQSHQVSSETTLVKEVTVGNLKATANFPPLVAGRESQFELELRKKDSGSPISDATVSFHVAYLHKAEDSDRHGAHAVRIDTDTIPHRATVGHDVNLELEVEQSSQRGIYSIAFTPSQPGTHTVMFHVTAIGHERLDPELVLEATRTVASASVSHGGMMHGMGSASGYLIVGGALMGAMMIILWATRWGMF